MRQREHGRCFAASADKDHDVTVIDLQGFDQVVMHGSKPQLSARCTDISLKRYQEQQNGHTPVSFQSPRLAVIVSEVLVIARAALPTVAIYPGYTRRSIPVI